MYIVNFPCWIHIKTITGNDNLEANCMLVTFKIIKKVKLKFAIDLFIHYIKIIKLYLVSTYVVKMIFIVNI